LAEPAATWGWGLTKATAALIVSESALAFAALRLTEAAPAASGLHDVHPRLAARLHHHHSRLGWHRLAESTTRRSFEAALAATFAKLRLARGRDRVEQHDQTQNAGECEVLCETHDDTLSGAGNTY